jgi:glycosyltransferase involved in cell wall biosynthesis
MTRIHFHSECNYFAGSEKVLFLIMNKICQKPYVEVTFSFKENQSYTKAVADLLDKRIKIIDLIKPNFFEKQTDLKFGRITSFIKKFAVRFIFFIEIYKFYNLFRQLRPDILHVNNGGYPGAFSARAAVLGGKAAKVKRILMVVNNLAADYKSIARKFDYPTDLMVFASVNLFITGSKLAGSKLSSIGVNASKIAQIPNCSVDNLPALNEQYALELNKYKNRIILGVFGQLIKRKGHKEFFYTISQIQSNDFICVIVGSGEEYEFLAKYVRELNIENKVIFIPDNVNYKAIMNCCDIIVQPSLEFEDFPLTVVEALSLGKPIIGNNVGGISEQLDFGRVGFVVEPYCITELKIAIETLLKNEDMRDELSIKAHQHYEEQYTRNTVIEKYFLIYDLPYTT